jgi:hypothetical protein
MKPKTFEERADAVDEFLIKLQILASKYDVIIEGEGCGQAYVVHHEARKTKIIKPINLAPF